MTIPVVRQQSRHASFTREGFSLVVDDVSKLFLLQGSGDEGGDGDFVGHNHDSRYYREEETDAKYMPFTGGIFTGDVTYDGTTKAIFGDPGQYIHESAPTILSYVSAGRHEFTGDVWINKLKLPTTTDSVGIIEINGQRFLHAYGTNNVFLGEQCGRFTLTGGHNVGIGHFVMANLTSGANNIILGWYAGYLLANGTSNVGIGDQVLGSLSSGNFNVAIGDLAGYSLAGGTHNLFIGSQAGRGATGTGNTSFGANTLWTASGANYRVAIGYEAGYFETGANKLFIDNLRRADEADGRVKALIYGVFAAATADQSLTFNSSLTVRHDILSPNNAKHYFDDGAEQGTEYITSDANGRLDLHAATSVDINANLTTATIDAIGRIYVYHSLRLTDDIQAYFGTHYDSSIYDDNANLIINPDALADGSKLYVGPTANKEAAASKWHVTTAGTEYLGSAGANKTGLYANNEIDFVLGGADQVLIRDGIMHSATPLDVGLGDSTYIWKDIYAGEGEIGSASHHIAFADDGELTLVGTARVINQFDFDLAIPRRPGANPPGEGTIDNFPTLDFDDTTEESVFLSFHLNHGYVDAGLVRVHVDFLVDTAPVGAANAVWGVEYKKVSHGDNFDFSGGTSTVTVVSAVTTGTPANDEKVHETSALSFTTAGFVAGDTLYMRFHRVPGHGSDTFTGDVRVIGEIHVEWLQHKLGEAT